jgi:hypothetical protein
MPPLYLVTQYKPSGFPSKAHTVHLEVSHQGIASSAQGQDLVSVPAHCGRGRLLDAGSSTCFDGNWIHAPQAPGDCIVERWDYRPGGRAPRVIERVAA